MEGESGDKAWDGEDWVDFFDEDFSDLFDQGGGVFECYGAEGFAQVGGLVKLDGEGGHVGYAGGVHEVGDCGELVEYGWVGNGFAIGRTGNSDVASLGMDKGDV